MPEDEREIWKRLEDLGLWAAASEWMRDRRRELGRRFPKMRRGKGYHKLLKELVWAECAQKFPKKQEGDIDPAALPPSPKKVSDDDFELSAEDLDSLLAGDMGTPEGFREDLLWVYAHVPDRRITLENCPSSGAFGMLQWARKKSDQFYALYNRVMQDEAKDSRDEILGDDGREQLVLIGKLQAAAGGTP